MSTIETRSAGPNRPISPHLEIYRYTWTMAMSIVHRGTGIVLMPARSCSRHGSCRRASGKGAYDSAQWLFGSFLGRLVLFGYTWALLHHLIGGIRHFVWDVGSGYDPRTRQVMAMWNLILSIALTLVIWIIGYIVR